MKVLVVEDDRKVAGFIEQGLKEEGYVVDIAPDGEEATMLAHVYDYDVILLDVVLPQLDGITLCRMLKSDPATARIPLYMLTAKARKADVDAATSAGADGYIHKPFRGAASIP